MKTLRFSLYDLRRLRSDWSTILFSVLLPVAFYLIFGSSQDAGDVRLRDGNGSVYVMIGMALYAGAVGAVSAASNVVLELQTGWGRQLALTPLRPYQILISNLTSITVRAVLPITAVYVTGFFTESYMPRIEWISSFLLVFLSALPFGVLGLAVALVLRTTNAVSVASTAVVVSAAAGNVFMPLSEALFGFSRFTPMYGPAALARYPLTDGDILIQGETPFVNDPLWYALVNIVLWLGLYVILCLSSYLREKGRM